jgi:penicillin amidase
MHRLAIVLTLLVPLAAPVALAGHKEPPRPQSLPGLQAGAEVTRDVHGIAHIKAGNEHDLFFLQGYVHAQDRLFQMDAARRQASGTLAELLGPGAIPSDVNLRTLGIRRAAVRSASLLSARARKAVEAYAEGVNQFVRTHALPPEYAVLEITRFEPWTPLDTVTVAKSIAFSLSFGLEDIDHTQALLSYQAALGAPAGGALFSLDLWRAQADPVLRHTSSAALVRAPTSGPWRAGTRPPATRCSPTIRTFRSARRRRSTRST